MITNVGAVEPVLDMVNMFGPWGPLTSPWAFGGSPATQNYESAGRTVYYPLYIPVTCVVRRFWWANGTTVSGATTVKAGVYSSSGFKPGIKLGTEATAAQGTTVQVQFQAPTGGDFVLGPGSYWFGFYASAASQFMRQSMGSAYNALVKFQETAVLPATATPIEPSGSEIWFCGFSTTTLT